MAGARGDDGNAEVLEEEAARIADSCGQSAAQEDDVPELLDLIDAAEQKADDPSALAGVFRDIGRRLHTSPGDRDLLCDFEGIAQICKALSGPPHSWQGEAMLAFCKIMPVVCRMSKVNRGCLRDEGFVAAAVELLRHAGQAGDEAAAVAATIALSSTCTANDGNKKAAAQLPSAESAEAAEAKPGAILLLLEALGHFQESATLQTEAIAAFRSLITDDDPREADCEPAAVENREVALSDHGFPYLAAAVERGLGIAEASETPNLKLVEQTLLLLRELARRKDQIQVLAMEAKMLKRVQALSLKSGDARVVRAGLSVLRAFASVEEVRDELGLLSDGARDCLVAVRRHMDTPAVCEQGFGLFQNLTMRKSPITARLNDADHRVVDLGQAVLRRHACRPDVSRSVIHTLRNVSSQDDASCAEVKQSDVFELVRELVRNHEGEQRWNTAVDISRQFLREYRADGGMEKKAQFNPYY